MIDGMNITVGGLGELQYRILALPNRAINKWGRRALRTAARPIIEAARAGAPVRYGYLRSSLGVVIRTYRNALVAVIGARRDAKHAKRRRFSHRLPDAGGREQYAVPANYAHLVERGTRPHALGPQVKLGRIIGTRVERTGHDTGRRIWIREKTPGAPRVHPGARAQPFLAPAIAANRENTQRIVAEVLRQGLRSEAT